MINMWFGIGKDFLKKVFYFLIKLNKLFDHQIEKKQKKTYISVLRKCKEPCLDYMDIVRIFIKHYMYKGLGILKF